MSPSMSYYAKTDTDKVAILPTVNFFTLIYLFVKCMSTKHIVFLLQCDSCWQMRRLLTHCSSSPHQSSTFLHIWQPNSNHSLCLFLPLLDNNTTQRGVSVI